MATWAIGDVHGCIDKLRRLWARIGPGPGDKVVFLGDLIDRGPDSRGVIEFVRGRSRHGVRIVALQGNHEYMCLKWHRTRDPQWWKVWRRNGGDATLASYGVSGGRRPPTEGLPAGDLDFLAAMPLFHREGAVVFVHAGLRPGIDLERQAPEDLLWIREEFLDHPEAFPQRVVFGHTPAPEVLRRGTLVGIDTGAVYGPDRKMGRLTAYEPFRNEVVQVS